MSYATVRRRQICCGLFTNLTENFLISLLPKSTSEFVADALTCPHFNSRVGVTKNLCLFEIAFVLVRLDHVASFIVNANHSIV
jgi:hypothetical protein